ncbi:TonB-dependent receptor [Govanella unica]|uniref:TonB-dependent receptor n=1 Tax=Govanella unica TaxID=2975056 RepID=A0A9X3TVW3_9PROT|nr:TonB-dependent receptor [Govania unica]MDA5192674.1 TonB-dependent receptor [Govania unica]
MTRTWDVGTTAVKLVAVAGLLSSTAAMAETAVLAGIEEITVTAQRRAENLQSVPISITAFSDRGLEARGVETTEDLAQFTPGLTFSNNAVIGQAYIRGIGSNQLNIGSDPSVAVSIDGVYIARPTGSIQTFLDVERVEVLKGPQGTLYGRNATGGAINIISQAPTAELTGKVSLSMGNYEALSGAAMVSGPIVADKLLARVSVGRDKRDGFQLNVFNDERVNNLNNTQARAIFDFLPTDGLKIRLAGDIYHERSTRGLAAYVTVPGPPTLRFNTPIRSDYEHADMDARLGAKVDAHGLSATITKDMGDLTATSISAYRYSHYQLNLDLDFSGYAFAQNEPQLETSKTFTQEFRLASGNDQPLTWIAGLYYLNERAATENNYTFFATNIVQRPAGKTRTNAYAAFGEAYYRPWEPLRLTVGLRYSTEKRAVDVESRTNGVLSSFQGSSNFDAFTPKFGIDFTLAKDVMAYASVTRGFKSGGYNATSVTNPAFMPEKVWAYEAGIKSSLFDNRMRLNAAAFYYDYTDLQVIESVPGQRSNITNAAAATIKGLEVDTEVVVTEGLTLSGALSLLDAKYDRYSTIDSERPSLGLLNLKGKTLPRSPKFTATLGATYVVDMNWGNVTFRGDYSHTSKIQFVAFNTPAEIQKGYDLVNARVTIEPKNSGWNVSAWVRNLTDTHYAQLILTNSGFWGTAEFPGNPRTYGLTVDYSF